VTAPGAGGGPHVRVFTAAGADAGVSFFATAPSFGGGVRVAVAGPGGGVPPLIVTAPGPGPDAYVRRFSATGIPLDAGFLTY
jgi:hypothetical protein